MEPDPTEMTSDQLVDEALELSERLKQDWLSEARKDPLARRLSYIVFEYKYRTDEALEAV